MNIETEEWKDIPWAPGYRASNMGRVQSIKHGKWKDLSVKRDNQQVSLYFDGRREFISTCKIVASLFVEPYYGYNAYHLDGDQTNNKAKNLVWLSREEVGPFLIQNGLILRGEECQSAKLTEEQVLEIRAIYAAGYSSQRSLARQFGVDQATIWAIVVRKSWTHI